MKKSCVSVLLFILGASMVSHARGGGGGGGSGVLFDVNLYYGSSATATKVSGTETKNESKVSLYDIKLGNITGAGLYYGAIYSSRTNSVLNANGESGSALGASIGYFGSGGFFIQGHCLLSATIGDFKDGSGVQADLGYKTNIGGNWLIGAEMTYKNITYKKSDTNASLESYNTTDMYPMISIGLMF